MLIVLEMVIAMLVYVFAHLIMNMHLIAHITDVSISSLNYGNRGCGVFKRELQN